MSKLNVKKSDLESFSIDQVKDFEGCASALKFLKQRFGDRVDNLANCKREVLQLIDEDNKEDWVINFMLNLLSTESRLSFYTSRLKSSLSEFNNKKFTSQVLKLMRSLDEKEVLLFFQSLDDQNDEDNYKKTVLESILFLSQDEQKRYTRSITDGLMKLAEANVHIDIVKYNYDSNIKVTAKSLMEFVGLWK